MSLTFKGMSYSVERTSVARLYLDLRTSSMFPRCDGCNRKLYDTEMCWHSSHAVNGLTGGVDICEECALNLLTNESESIEPTSTSHVVVYNGCINIVMKDEIKDGAVIFVGKTPIQGMSIAIEEIEDQVSDDGTIVVKIDDTEHIITLKGCCICFEMGKELFQYHTHPSAMVCEECASKLDGQTCPFCRCATNATIEIPTLQLYSLPRDTDIEKLVEITSLLSSTVLKYYNLQFLPSGCIRLRCNRSFVDSETFDSNIATSNGNQ